MKFIALMSFTLLVGFDLSHAETLTDIEGRTITAKIIAKEGENVKIQMENGQFATVPIDRLDLKSRELIDAIEPKNDPDNPSLKVVSNAGGRVTDSHWETSWGSYDKDIYRSRSIKVIVDAMSPGQAIIRVSWIGRAYVETNNPRVVLVSERPVIIETARVPVSVEFAALFEENDANYAALGERDRDGIKYVGWVVQLVSKDGSILASSASRPPLMRIVSP
jgi:hypothetical protein